MSTDSPALPSPTAADLLGRVVTVGDGKVWLDAITPLEWR
jgi:hypothetical protein